MMHLGYPQKRGEHSPRHSRQSPENLGSQASGLVLMIALAGCQLDRTPIAKISEPEDTLTPPATPGVDGGGGTGTLTSPIAREGGVASRPSPSTMDPKPCMPGQCKPGMAGSACTGNSQCDSGHCSGGICCERGACCTENATCKGGVIGPGTPVCYRFMCCQPKTECAPTDCGSAVDDGCGGTLECPGCDDKNPCTDDMCMNGACVHSDNAAACDDGLYCNGDDVCAAGKCTHAGDPCGPADMDDNCKEACSEADKSCTANDPSGSPCDDGIGCTMNDICTGGKCAGRGDNAMCDDKDMCTIDRCDTKIGCVSLDNGLCASK